MKDDDPVSVLLVVPPFYALGHPSLGTATLKSALAQKGISCKVLYANAQYAREIGTDLYQLLMSVVSPADLYQEQVFAEAAHGSPIHWQPAPAAAPDFYARYYDLYGNKRAGLSEQGFTAAVDGVEGFLERFIAEVRRVRPKIVGFSSLYSQINASLALARRLKQLFPEVIVVMGGSNCYGEMGEELKRVECLDYVFDGEADVAFPAFCEAVLAGQPLPTDKLIRCPSVTDLDPFDIPDYTDFLAQFRPEERDTTFLYFETSRGCWWGVKHRCRFCGISYDTMAFRTKSPQRAAQQLCELRQRYPDYENYYACDSVFPNTYFDEFFDTLAAHQFDGRIFYQIKPTLDFDKLKKMKAHGIHSLGPGIESLSSRHLKMMKKGTTAVRNIALLRNCRELEIEAKWNHLVALPQDCGADYEALAELLPLLQHLDPPIIIPIYIQRFSPYFDEPEQFGIEQVRPMEGYLKSFPEHIDLMKLAYNFNGQIETEVRRMPELLARFYIEVRKWYTRWGSNPAELAAFRAGGRVMVRDTRDCAVEAVTEIGEEELAVLQQCRTPRKQEGITANVGNLLRRGFLVDLDDSFLTLVCGTAELVTRHAAITAYPNQVSNSLMPA